MTEPDHALVWPFETEERVPVPAVTAEQMREVDRVTLQEQSPSLLQMMENAGRSLAEVTLGELGDRFADASVLVLAGGGGNGGGGICAARHLTVRVREVLLCIADPARLTGAAHRQH